MNYDDLYGNKSFAAQIIEEAQKVCFRRFVITAPRDNLLSEAFKFSSRHSEFIKLKAEALLSDGTVQAPGTKERQPVDNQQQYKVVIQYPDGTHTQSLLGVKREPG